MNTTSIDIRLEGIGHALSDKRLSVPIYQRSYAWEDKHVKDLLLDISNAIQNNETEYFLGSVVIIQDDVERLTVVDGQQRLATITIFIAAIRDYFNDNGETARATDLENEYLSKRDLVSQEKEAKLKLNEIDNNFFYKRIVLNSKKEKAEPNKESHKRIEKAYAIAREHVGTLAKSTNDPVSLLLKHVIYVANQTKVIWVVVPDNSNAFTIFETLNDRGLDLAISDLLKNYLFYLSDNRVDEVMQKWNSMVSIIESNSDESEIVNYIRYLWSSTYGVARERDLYDTIKRKTTSKQAAVDFTERLEKNSKLYSAILNPEHEYWNDMGTTAKNYIFTLKLLGMVQIRPLLLAVLDKFNKTEIIKSLKLLTSAVVRYTVTGTLSTGVFETQFSQWAIDVRNGKIENASDLLKSMKRSIPIDSSFQEAFSKATVSKSYLARYYLTSLEKHIKNSENPELVPNENEQEVNLEHILPQSLSSNWSHIDEEIAKTYFRRLGNMCLLKVKINSKSGNDSFDFKKEFYKLSELVLTSELAKIKNWDTAAINKRQSYLAELAVKTWNLNLK